MLQNIVSDLQLYLRLLRMQIRSQAQYKVDMAVNIVTYFAVTSLEFTVVFLYFAAFPSLLGWHVGEVAMLYAIMSIGFGCSELFGAGIDLFPDTIRLGEFDRVLLRPASALLQVAASDFRLRRFGRITQGCVAFIISLQLLPGFHWTLAKCVVLLISIVSGAALFIAVLLLGATMCFWTVETTELVNILTYGGRDMLTYPLTIYNQTFQRFFLFVVPLAFGTFVPTCYLLGRPLPFGLPNAIVFVSPLIALIFAFIARFVWQFGVRHYQSSGS
jgi:ABC-2 type transport system permease protein